MNPNAKLSIVKYEIDLLERRIVFFLKEYQGTRSGKAVFDGVWGHHFANVLDGNIVEGIKESSPNVLYEKYSDLLKEYQQNGFPFNCFDEEEFCIRVAKRSLKPIIITGQYGFNGWIMCESMSINMEESAT